MRPILSLLLIAAIGGLALSQPPAAKFDPEAAFKRGDTNGDGKLSLEEFLKLTQNNPRFKENPDLAKQVFKRLDTDGNGFLSHDEFKKMADLGKKGKEDPQPKVNEPPAKQKDTTKEKTPAVDQLAFFEKKIRPVLVAKCYGCHSQESGKHKGDLFADSREGLRKGGDSGPAVVPGDLKASLLIKAIRHTDSKLQMPEEKLPATVIADFEKWVSAGAVDPREGSVKVAKSEIDIEKGRKFWAFQKPIKHTVPKVGNASWPRTEIDKFILAGLEAKNLKPVAEADPYTLIRRLYFDLVGLPPGPEEVQEFVKEYTANSQVAVEKVVDRLLASPQFGERWGRHWLDVARYGESTGKSVNHLYPHAWRYRDYVIQSFNADKPYDVFIREQLAGDLLPASNDKQKAEQTIATGFLAIGSKSINERIPLQFQMDLVDEQIDTTFLAFQAMTVACARCHDHKFDPIPTKDYYALAGIFRSTETCYGTIRLVQSNQPSALISLPAGAGLPAGEDRLTPEERQKTVKQIEDLKKQRDDIVKAEGAKAAFLNLKTLFIRNRISLLESKLDSYLEDGSPKLVAMGARDRSRTMDSPVFTRGEIAHPSTVVARGFVQVFRKEQPKIAKGSGRLELAEWISSKDNPLTARVMANRIWLHLFGRGLVATPDNFGASGELPSNLPLLDYLAVSLVEKGWSTKKLIKQIVMSRAYQLDSRHDERNVEVDPDNVLVWRMSKQRLEAEAIRDAMLSVSGLLDLTPPKGSAVAKVGEGPAQTFGRIGMLEAKSTQRSIYSSIIRDQVPEVLALFDFPDPSLVTGERATTTVPSQSLFMMNNPFVFRQAQTTADRVLATGSDDSYRLNQTYLKFYGRLPTSKEVTVAKMFLMNYAAVAPKKSVKEQERAAWTALCQALFASAEFLYRN